MLNYFCCISNMLHLKSNMSLNTPIEHFACLWGNQTLHNQPTFMSCIFKVWKLNSQGNHECVILLGTNRVFLGIFSDSLSRTSIAVLLCVCAKSLQSCLTLCDTMDYSLPGSSVHGILQARKLQLVAMPSSRGSLQPRDWTCISYVSCTGRRLLYH